jgi:formylglycine-generating enzyme required for sulfatase activity
MSYVVILYMKVCFTKFLEYFFNVSLLGLIMLISVGSSTCSTAQSLPEHTLTEALPTSIQIQPKDGEGAELLITWENDWASEFEVFGRDKLGTGEWGIVAKLKAGSENTQTFKVDLSSTQSSFYYQVRKVPHPLVSLQSIMLSEDVTMDFVKVSSGTFKMGGSEADPDIHPIETPQTTVSLSKDYLLGKYEVTQDQWNVIMVDNPSAFAGGDLPVERVTWFKAVEFCERLTKREVAAGRLPDGYAFGLPTEAQWEYACRAGSEDRFYYGQDPDYSELSNYAWYRDNSDYKTHPVGEKLPNAWGLYDMYGNVTEWCSDWLVPLPGGHVTDLNWNDAGILRGRRVRRGGDMRIIGMGCRSSRREAVDPYYKDDALGFRVALSWQGE